MISYSGWERQDKLKLAILAISGSVLFDMDSDSSFMFAKQSSEFEAWPRLMCRQRKMSPNFGLFERWLDIKTLWKSSLCRFLMTICPSAIACLSQVGQLLGRSWEAIDTWHGPSKGSIHIDYSGMTYMRWMIATHHLSSFVCGERVSRWGETPHAKLEPWTWRDEGGVEEGDFFWIQTTVMSEKFRDPIHKWCSGCCDGCRRRLALFNFHATVHSLRRFIPGFLIFVRFSTAIPCQNLHFGHFWQDFFLDFISNG